MRSYEKNIDPQWSSWKPDVALRSTEGVPGIPVDIPGIHENPNENLSNDENLKNPTAIPGILIPGTPKEIKKKSKNVLGNTMGFP